MLVPNIKLPARYGGEWVTISIRDILYQEAPVILFGVEGAFMDNEELLYFENNIETIVDAGYCKVFCTSVNDTFTMNAWAAELDIKYIDFIPDGNGLLAKSMCVLNPIEISGMGYRSYKYIAEVYRNKIRFLHIGNILNGIKHKNIFEG